MAASATVMFTDPARAPAPAPVAAPPLEKTVSTMIQRADSVRQGSVEIFDAIDLDNNGTINRDEFHRLFDAMRSAVRKEHAKEDLLEWKASKAHRRFRLVAIFAIIAVCLLALSVLANALTINFVIQRNQQTKVSTNGLLLAKQSTDEIRVAERSHEVPIGLLPYLVINDPDDALESVPGYITLALWNDEFEDDDNDDANETANVTGLPAVRFHAFKVESIDFAPPLQLTIMTAEGDQIVIGGAVSGYVQSFTTGQRRSFCPACAPINLRSLRQSNALTRATTAFEQAVGNATEDERDQCEGDIQIAGYAEADEFSVAPLTLTAMAAYPICSLPPDLSRKEGEGAATTRQLSHITIKYCDDIPVNKWRDSCNSLRGNLDYVDINGLITDVRIKKCAQYDDKKKVKKCGRKLEKKISIELFGTEEDLDSDIDRIRRGSRFGGCHPPHAMLELAKGQHRRIDQLVVGDHIRTPSGFEPVVGFLHQDPTLSMTYYVFRTAQSTLHVSAYHWIFVDGVEADPATARIGQHLTSSDGALLPILAISTREEVGAYHLVTPSGSYFVDGVLASTYVAYLPKWAWQVVGNRYITLRYHVGLPVLPQGQQTTALSHFWLRDTLEAAGVPNGLQATLTWPALVVSVVITELANAFATAVHRTRDMRVHGVASSMVSACVS